MPRVHTQKAGKDYPSHNIKKGETYYWWKFRHGGKVMSKTPPKPSQLTMSKMSAAYAASEDLDSAIDGADSLDDLKDALQTAADAIRDVGQEYRDSAENIREHFPESPTADDCEEKADGLEAWADDIENAISEVDGIDASDHVDEDLSLDDLDDEMIETVDGERRRKAVEDFDDLTTTEASNMLEEARETARGVVECPL